MASTRSTGKKRQSKRPKSDARRKNMTSTIQWLALVTVVVLFTLAVFAFNVGGAGLGGGRFGR